jgi:hydrogenase large subunit
MSEKITINPITRISGFMQVEVVIEKNMIIEAKTNGFLFRGFEEMLKGRSPLDAVYFTERICGICSTAHGYVSSVALENALGVKPDENGSLLRDVMHGCEFLQNHIRHFYQFTIPDYAKVDINPVNDNVRQYKLPKDINSKLNSHYMQAFKYSRDAHKMLALLGGKAPHNHGIFVGGVTASIDATKLIELKSILFNIREFINTSMMDDVQTIAKYYPEDFKNGKGYGNFLSYGAFDKDLNNLAPYVKSGVYIDKRVHEFNPANISEDIINSYYTDAVGVINGDKELKPDATKKEAYTWVKAARYNEIPMEVGPLARLWISGEYSRGISTLDRIIARVLEAKRICDILESILELLKPGVSNQRKLEIPQIADGVGLRDTTRGALGHWLKIENQKIKNYNIITPSGWNISPTDSKGNKGVIEKALIGTYVENSKVPSEIGRIVRSFDPCVSCATHVISDNCSDFTMRLV